MATHIRYIRHIRSPEAPPRRPDRPRFGEEADDGKDRAIDKLEARLRRAVRTLWQRLDTSEQ